MSIITLNSSLRKKFRNPKVFYQISSSSYQINSKMFNLTQSSFSVYVLCCIMRMRMGSHGVAVSCTKTVGFSQNVP